MKKISISSLNDLEDLSKGFLQNLEGLANVNEATVVTLTGDLGAGKTTFVQMLARNLGVKEVVQSPTFTIFKIYETENDFFKTLVHMDAYRIDDVSELRPLNFFEILKSPNTLFCIEWAERIKEAIPAEAVSLTFEYQSGEERLVSIKGISV